MKQLFLFIISLLAYALSFGQIATNRNNLDIVKSVYLTPAGDEMGLPILHMGQFGDPTGQLLLRFDLLEEHPDDLRYRFLHCNAEWKVDSLELADFFSGPNEMPITNYQSSFTTLRNYSNYYQLLPDPSGYFLISGNYILEVFPTDYPDSVLFSRRFVVCEDIADISATVDKTTSGYGNINNDQEVSIAVTPQRNSFLLQQPNYYHVVVQQNRREDLKRTMPFSNYSGESLVYRWKKENVFPGGNHFRYFDISNLRAAMYHVARIEMLGNDVFAFLQPDDVRGRKAYTQYNSLNGGMKTNIRDRNNPHIESDYVWVNFSLPMERPYLDGNIYIVGDLTLWSLDDNSRMDWNQRYKAYTKRLLLKQGYYSYQLLFLPTNESEAETSRIEGDHAVMTNTYNIFVYYRAPGARYDRLVGFKTTTR